MSFAQLRSYVFIDSLQPQLSAHNCTGSRGFFPVPGVASLYIETLPGMAIHRLLDAGLKATRAQPATIVVERRYGLLELHHEDKGEVHAAGEAVLESMGAKIEDREAPRVVSNSIVRSIEPMHAMIIDKMRFGSMITPDQSLLIFETEPAPYVALAANEAEKAADVLLVDVRQYGAFGRLYMAGTESEIDSAAQAATAVIEGMAGRTAAKYAEG
jgi:hypothetical protein